MSVRKIGSSWRVDIRCEGCRYRIRSPENSKTGAAAYEAMLRQRLARGEPINGHREEAAAPLPYFEEFSTKWYTTYVVTNNKPSEQKGKRIILHTHLVPFFGKLRLNEITGLNLEEYKTAKQKVGLSAKTINNHLAVLSRCLHMAQEWVGLGNVPKIKFLKVPPQSFDFLSTEESESLLASIKDKGWYAMILVALRAGLRLGELLGLEWQDVNLGTQLLTVRRSMLRGVASSPKSNRARHIPLTNEVKEALLTLGPAKGLIFCRTEGLPMHHETPRKNLIKMCKNAGLRRIGWHMLRHTFASQLVAAGASIKAVQELLGHSDIQTTMRYAHLAPSALRSAVALLDRPKDSPSEDFGHQMGTAPTIMFTRKLETAPSWGRFAE